MTDLNLNKPCDAALRLARGEIGPGSKRPLKAQKQTTITRVTIELSNHSRLEIISPTSEVYFYPWTNEPPEKCSIDDLVSVCERVKSERKERPNA